MLDGEWVTAISEHPSPLTVKLQKKAGKYAMVLHQTPEPWRFVPLARLSLLMLGTSRERWDRILVSYDSPKATPAVSFVWVAVNSNSMLRLHLLQFKIILETYLLHKKEETYLLYMKEEIYLLYVEEEMFR